jgi:hypothetical protein
MGVHSCVNCRYREGGPVNSAQCARASGPSARPSSASRTPAAGVRMKAPPSNRGQPLSAAK